MFLLRRNLPLAWAGWYDDFTSYSVGTIQPPWVHLGDGTTADIDVLHRLHIPSNFATSNVGGESYEFMPFTPNWGLELSFEFPVTGLAGQGFSVYLTDSWTKIGATFANCIGVRMLHDPALFSDSVQVTEFDSPTSANFSFTRWDSPVTFNGTVLNLRVWVDEDQFIRVWLQDTYLGSVMVTSAYKFSPTRRCVRFSNVALCDVWVHSVDHYDRPGSFPNANVWSSIFYDDFARPDGAVGNGWTQSGSDAQLTSGVWVHTGGTDDSCAILRDTGLTGGKVRVMGTVRSPNGTADCSLYALANSAGTQALAANIYNNKIYISRLSGSLTSPTWNDYTALTSGVAVNDGDQIALGVYGDLAWIEQNGTRVAYASGISTLIPATNSLAGARVSHSSLNASGGWDDIRIYSGI